MKCEINHGFDIIVLMKRYVAHIMLLLLLLGFFIPREAYADMPSYRPPYPRETCKLWEIETVCPFDDWDDPLVRSCHEYANDPRFRYIGGEIGWSKDSRLCSTASSFPELIRYHLERFYPTYLLTLIIELPAFFILGFRSRKALVTFFSANTITKFLLYLITHLLGYIGYLHLFILELLIVVFEIFYVCIKLENYSIKKIIFVVTVTNVLSVALGSFILKNPGIVLYYLTLHNEDYLRIGPIVNFSYIFL